MSKVALIIIYNHQYTKNIKIIEDLYKNRFKNIFHLMPFYQGTETNVIPVYENSYYFQGYVAQGFKHFFREDFDDYLFIADDLVLNPIINEDNYRYHFKLTDNACFISNFCMLHNIKDWWWARVEEALSYKIEVPGVEVKGQLPDYEQALNKFNQFKLDIMPLDFDQIWKKPGSFKILIRWMLFDDRMYFFKRIWSKIFRIKYYLKYPIVGGYSDIFIVSSKNIKQFCQYCGAFSATKLFVELAIPTALVLSSEAIITEEDLDFKGQALWTLEQYKILEKYKEDLSLLLSDFPSNNLYLHPIKLSKWSKVK